MYSVLYIHIYLFQDHVNHFTVNGISDVNSEALKSLSNAIRDLIAPCFGIDLLKLERVTWSSPGNLLQNISEGEAVHSIRSWPDLKKRLGPYRRCFILSHQSLPLRPLAILHVALTAEISSSIHSIINRIPLTPSFDSESENAVAGEVEDTQIINTAVFYSISSTQKGLAVIYRFNYMSMFHINPFHFLIGNRLGAMFNQTSRAPSSIRDTEFNTVFNTIAHTWISFLAAASVARS